MGCPNPTRWADLAAGRASTAQTADLERHRAGCAACAITATRVAMAQRTLRDIAASPVAVTPVSQARIEAALRWSRTAPTLPAVPGRAAPLLARWGWGAGLAVAAAAVAFAVAWPAWHAAAPRSTPAVAASVVAPPAPQPLRRQSEAIVTLLAGDVRLQRGGAPAVPLDAKTKIVVGDRLLTGSGARLGLQWGDGRGALLGPEGDLQWLRFDDQLEDLSLRRGRVGVRAAGLMARRVATPGHAVAMQSGWVVIAADARGTRVEVLEGVVEVSALEGDASSTRLAAPEQAFFPFGRGLAEGARPLAGREAAALRLANEIGLLAAWTAQAVEASGVLSVQSTPQAAIAVDAVPFGATPLLLRRPRGRHFIELSRPGFTTLSRWITVGAEPGELRLALKQEVSPPAEVAPAPDEIATVVQGRRRQIRACYEHSLKRNPSLAGTVTLSIAIGPAGQVSESRVSANTLDDEEVTACLRQEASGWLFEHARNATVIYPFVFRTPSAR